MTAACPTLAAARSPLWDATISNYTTFPVKNDGAAEIKAENNYWGTISWFGYAAVTGIKDRPNGAVDWEPWSDSTLTAAYSKPATLYVDDNNLGSLEEVAGASGGIFGYNAFDTIQDGVNNAVDAAVVNVQEGSYNESVLIAKPINLKKDDTATTLPIVTGAGQNVITVTAADSIIDGLNLKVNQVTCMRGIYASGAYNNIIIRNNLIQSTNPLTTGMVFDSFGILFDGYGTNQITVQSNTILPEDNTKDSFGRGVRFYGCHGTVGGALPTDRNTIGAFYAMQWSSNNGGAMVIRNNALYGTTTILQPAAFNHVISDNTFSTNGPAYAPNIWALLEIRSNLTVGSMITVEDNQFEDYIYFGVFSGRSRNVVVKHNTFTPLAGAGPNTYRHVGVNTKQQTAGIDPPTPSAIAIVQNTFNGAAGSGGTAIEIADHNASGNPANDFDSIIIGGAGDENIFKQELTAFISLDGAAGNSTAHPFWATYPNTTMSPAAVDVDVRHNTFGVAGGEKLPAAMTIAELFEVEDKIQHKIDYNPLGFATVVPSQSFVTGNSFYAPYTIAALIQRGVDAVAAGGTVNVLQAVYNESVALNKSVTLLGEDAGIMRPIILGAGQNAITVSATDVTIDNFNLKVNQAACMRGIYASGAYNNITIRNNLIQSTNPLTTGMVFDSYGILFDGYGTNQITVQSNTILPEDNTKDSFGRGVRFYGCHGTVGGALPTDGNTIGAFYAMQWSSNNGGAMVIRNNALYGTTTILQPAAFNHVISDNTFSAYGPAYAPTIWALLEIRSNLTAGSTITVEDNQFEDYIYFGVFSSRSRNVVVKHNTFTPIAGAGPNTYRHVGVNTKQQTAGIDPPTPSAIAIIQNTFNGAAGSGGTAIEIADHNASGNPANDFDSIIIGGAGDENIFKQELTAFISLDGAAGNSTAHPYWATYPNTTMSPAAVDVDVRHNTFGVAGGEKLPAAMTIAELFEVEDKIQHKIDYNPLGFATVVPSQSFVTGNSFYAPYTAAALIQRGVDAVAAGGTVNVLQAVYNESVALNKSVTLLGEDAGIMRPIILGAGLNAITVSATDVTIDNFNIKVNQVSCMRGIYASAGFDNLTIQNNLIESIHPLTTGMVFDSYGVFLDGFTNANINIRANTIYREDNTRDVFGRGIRLHGCHGNIGGAVLADGNTIGAFYNIQWSSTNGGAFNIQNNLLQGNAQILQPGAFNHTILNNTFTTNGAAYAPSVWALLDIRNNITAGSTITVEDNQFEDHIYFGVFSGRSRNVVVKHNTFTPLAGAGPNTYRHVGVNTKRQTAGIDTPTPSAIAIVQNTFNGAAGSGGTAIEIADHNASGNPANDFDSIIIGGAGDENIFKQELTAFISLDGAAGDSTAHPYWATYPNTTMSPAVVDVDVRHNTFGVAGGEKLPAAMTMAEFFEVEDKVQHKIDYLALGLLTFKEDNVYVTTNSFYAPYTTIAEIQRGVDAVTSGGVVSVADGTYTTTNTLIASALTLQGQSRSGVVIAPYAEDDNVNSAFGGVNPQQAFVIRCNDVTIRDLTIDGQANPLLTAGKDNFRNAIITDWNFGSGSFNRIIVENVSIRNIFRRGVHLQVGNAPTGGHIISNSSFQNISALVDADAVGVFNSDAQITSNTFAAIPCAIKCDNVLAPSVPTRLVATKNRISGLIATPLVLSPAAMLLNAAADGTIIGGSALDANDIDLTIGGTPQDLGILVQPAGEAVISYNIIRGSAQDVGIAALGAPALQPIQILENTLTASGSADLGDGTAAGIWLCDSGDFAWAPGFIGSSYAILRNNTISGFAKNVDMASIFGNNIQASIGGTGAEGNNISGAQCGIRINGANAFGTITGNDIVGNDTGVLVENIAGALVNLNNISGNNLYGVNNTAGAAIDATCNWWGDASGPQHASNPGGLGNEVSDDAMFSPWATLNNYTCVPSVGLATQLVFVTEPTNTNKNFPIAPPPVVEARDADGNLAITFGGAILLSIRNNPSSGTLSGVTLVNAVNGSATFNGLSIDKPGAGYTLNASSDGLTTGVSAQFDIIDADPIIASIDPATATAGWAGFTLTVNGNNFGATSIVRWNGSDRPTHFISVNQLTADISASDIATTGSVNVTVINPGPGSVDSNAAVFTIRPVPTTVYVDDDWTTGVYDEAIIVPGAPSNPHYFGYDAFGAIVPALAEVEDAGIIEVFSGNYNEAIDIDKEVCLASVEGAATTVIDGLGTGRALTGGFDIPIAIRPTGNDAVSIEGFRFINSYIGIEMKDVAGNPNDYLIVMNCEFAGNDINGSAIVVEHSQADILGNRIEGLGGGIRIANSSNCNIIGNIITGGSNYGIAVGSDNVEGLGALTAENINIQSNIITNLSSTPFTQAYGIFVGQSDGSTSAPLCRNVTLDDNTITTCGHTAIMLDGINTPGDGVLLITNNRISNCGTYPGVAVDGIWAVGAFGDIFGGLIRMNEIHHHQDTAIQIDTGNFIIEGNYIAHNNIGVIVNGGEVDMGFGALGSAGLNNISINATLNLRNASPIDMWALKNYWGTTDYAAIELTIDHKPDNPAQGEVFFLPFTGMSEPDPVWVSRAFTIATPGWGYDHFDNITDGHFAVAAGGTIYIADGVYDAEAAYPIQIGKGVTVIGDSASGVIIRDPVSTVNTDIGVGTTLIEIIGNNVSISGMTIDGDNNPAVAEDGTNPELGHGDADAENDVNALVGIRHNAVSVSSTCNNLLLTNIIFKNLSIGVEMTGRLGMPDETSIGNRIEGCQFINIGKRDGLFKNGAGVLVTAAQVEITTNTFNFCDIGVRAWVYPAAIDMAQISINDNDFMNNYFGVLIDGSENTNTSAGMNSFDPDGAGPKREGIYNNRFGADAAFRNDTTGWEPAVGDFVDHFNLDCPTTGTFADPTPPTRVPDTPVGVMVIGGTDPLLIVQNTMQNLRRGVMVLSERGLGADDGTVTVLSSVIVGAGADAAFDASPIVARNRRVYGDAIAADDFGGDVKLYVYDCFLDGGVDLVRLQEEPVVSLPPTTFSVTLGGSIVNRNVFGLVRNQAINLGKFDLPGGGERDDVIATYNDFLVGSVSLAEAVIYHKEDDPILGRVIFLPAKRLSNMVILAANPPNVDNYNVTVNLTATVMDGWGDLISDVIPVIFRTSAGTLGTAESVMTSGGLALNTLFYNRNGIVNVLAEADSVATGTVAIPYNVTGEENLAFYPFDNPDLEGWIVGTPAPGTYVDAKDGAFYMAPPLQPAGQIGVNGKFTVNLYGYWHLKDSAAIPYAPNKIYRARYRVRTDQPDRMKSPMARLRWTNIVFLSGASLIVDKGLNAIGETWQDYYSYFLPPDLSGAPESERALILNFDLVNFSAEQFGALFLDEAEVIRFNIPPRSIATPALSYSTAEDFSVWVPETIPTLFGPVAYGRGTNGLYLESGATPSPPIGKEGLPDYGQWSVPVNVASVDYEPNRLYRAIFTLKVPDAATRETIARIRMRLHTASWDLANVYELFNKGAGTYHNHLPNTAGLEYSVFMESPREFYTGEDAYKNRIIVAFDLVDGVVYERGRVYLSKVEVEHYDLP